MRSPSLPDRRDTGNWLDVACLWAVSNPWRICAVICAAVLVVGFLDGPVS